MRNITSLEPKNINIRCFSTSRTEKLDPSYLKDMLADLKYVRKGPTRCMRLQKNLENLEVHEWNFKYIFLACDEI